MERRLPDGAPFRAIVPGEDLPLGVSVHAIDWPRRNEQPLMLPQARALAFGDAVVGAAGGLRVWAQRAVDERWLRWYRERLVPSLEPLLSLPVESVLVTHGDPVLTGGRAALARALAEPPWYHPG